jgi:polyisoprenoid-binding protein YceI
MKRSLLYILVLAFLLVACNGGESQPAAPDANDSPPTQTNEPAPVLAEEETPIPESPIGKSAGEEGIMTLQVVSTESQVTYEVGETFLGDNRFAVAIGVTSEVAGEITVDLENPGNSSLGVITADISQFKSDSARRDGVIQDRYLESSKYPLVTFVPTEISGLPDSYQKGDKIVFQVTGDATIRETTLPVTFDVTAALEGDTLTGEATTTFLMSDFEFGPISIAGMLETEDEVKIAFTFTARP